jgi:hypothetical protein
MSPTTKPALRKSSSRRARRLAMGSERPGVSVCLTGNGSWHLVVRDGAAKPRGAYQLYDANPEAWSLFNELPVLAARGASAQSLTDGIDVALDDASELSTLGDAVEAAVLDVVALAPKQTLANPRADVWVEPATVAWRLDARFAAPRRPGFDLAADHTFAPGGGHLSFTLYGCGGRRVAPWVALATPHVIGRFAQPIVDGLAAGVPPLTLGRAVTSSLAADDPIGWLDSALEVTSV